MQAQERILEFLQEGIKSLDNCFLFDVPLIQLLVHAVDNYLMACISVTAWWHEPC